MPRRAFFWLTLYLGTLAAMGPLAIDMYLPAFPRIAQSLGAGESDIQRTLASYFIGLAIGQLIYGPLTDRFGRKAPLYVGLTVFPLASAGCALAWSVPSLMVMRFIQALGGCAEMVISRAIVRDLFDDKQSAKVFSSLMLVMGLAPVLAPMVGAALARYVSWHAIFWVLTAAGLAAFLSTALFFKESLPKERRIKQSPGEVVATYGFLLRNRDFMLQAITVSMGLTGLFAYVGGSPIVFEKVFGIEDKHFAFYFAPIAMGIIGLSALNGMMAARFDIRRILRIALLLNTTAGLVLLTDAITGFGGFWGIYIPLWLFVACMGFVFPNTTVLAMSPHARIAGNASAVLGFLQFGISSLGGFVVSAFEKNQVTPTPVPMAATMAICGVAALGFNLLTRTTPTAAKPCDEAEASLLAAD